MCPVTTTPGSTGAGPGLITVSNVFTTGLEIPSKNPKLLRLFQHLHLLGYDTKTYCSCPASSPGRTSPRMVVISLMDACGVPTPKTASTSSFFFSIEAWLSPEMRMRPWRSWRKSVFQSGLLSSLTGSPRLVTASTLWPILNGSVAPPVVRLLSSIPSYRRTKCERH